MDLLTTLSTMPSPGESVTALKPFRETPGGKGSNQAMAAHRLSRYNPRGPTIQQYASRNKKQVSSIEVILVGCVGNDAYGDKILEKLAESQLDARRVQRVDGVRTGMALVLVEAGSAESRIVLHPGANHYLDKSKFRTLGSLTGNFESSSSTMRRQPVIKPDLLVLQLEMNRDAVEQIILTAHAEEVDVVLNAAPAFCLLKEVWQGVTHLIVNESEGHILWGENPDEPEVDWQVFTDLMLDRGVQNVVVTRGRFGAYCSNTQGRGHIIDAKRVRAVDTTTAGDTFVGAYAVAVVESMHPNGHFDIATAVRRACRAAEEAVKIEGTQESIPWKENVQYD
jgi:ribokinase